MPTQIRTMCRTKRGRTSTQLVRVEDVDWFEAEGNYVRLHVGKVTHLIRSTLRVMGDQLDP